MIHDDKAHPFLVSDFNLAAWKTLTVKQLEEKALVLTRKIDSMSKQSESIKSLMLETLNQLERYLEKRKQQEGYNDGSGTINS